MGNLVKIDRELFQSVEVDREFSIGSFSVEPFSISHDAADPVSFVIREGERKLGMVTDLGYYDEAIVEHLKNSDLLYVEANHDIRMLQVGKYPYYLKQRILGDRGHLSNENAGRLLCRLLHDNLKAVFLGHLSKENNYEQLAYETVCSEVTLGDNPYRSGDFRIQVARRDCLSQPVII